MTKADLALQIAQQGCLAEHPDLTTHLLQRSDDTRNAVLANSSMPRPLLMDLIRGDGPIKLTNSDRRTIAATQPLDDDELEVLIATTKSVAALGEIVRAHDLEFDQPRLEAVAAAPRSVTTKLLDTLLQARIDPTHPKVVAGALKLGGNDRLKWLAHAAAHLSTGEVIDHLSTIDKWRPDRWKKGYADHVRAILHRHGPDAIAAAAEGPLATQALGMPEVDTAIIDKAVPLVRDSGTWRIDLPNEALNALGFTLTGVIWNPWTPMDFLTRLSSALGSHSDRFEEQVEALDRRLTNKPDPADGPIAQITDEKQFDWVASRACSYFRETPWGLRSSGCRGGIEHVDLLHHPLLDDSRRRQLFDSCVDVHPALVDDVDQAWQATAGESPFRRRTKRRKAAQRIIEPREMYPGFTLEKVNVSSLFPPADIGGAHDTMLREVGDDVDRWDAIFSLADSWPGNVAALLEASRLAV